MAIKKPKKHSAVKQAIKQETYQSPETIKNDKPTGKSDLSYPIAQTLKNKATKTKTFSPNTVPASEYVAISKNKFKQLQKKNENKF